VTRCRAQTSYVDGRDDASEGAGCAARKSARAEACEYSRHIAPPRRCARAVRALTESRAIERARPELSRRRRGPPTPYALLFDDLVRCRSTGAGGFVFQAVDKGAEFTAGHANFSVCSSSPSIACTAGAGEVYIPSLRALCRVPAWRYRCCVLEVSSLIVLNRPGCSGISAVPENFLLPFPYDLKHSGAALLDTIGTSAHAGARFRPPRCTPEEAGPDFVTVAGPVGSAVILALREPGYARYHVSDPNS